MKPKHKQTINGKVYDTEKATLVAEVGNDAVKLRSVVETLYRTSNGNWFMHGQGGASTEYARHMADCITAGERITPITEDEALEWCELNLLQDAIEKHFGHRIEEA